MFKYSITKNFPENEWTVKNRNMGVAFSLGSWIASLSMVIIISIDGYFLENEDELNNPANW
jgi:hypothetical protein